LVNRRRKESPGAFFFGTAEFGTAEFAATGEVAAEVSVVVFSSGIRSPN
jgi:hypothetical protein